MNLDAFRLPLAPAPKSIQLLVDQGVDHDNYPENDKVRAVLDADKAHPSGVWRARDGRVLIVCNTTLANCSPEMLDWWFGWHLPSSERYRLWHPSAHIRCKVMEDRSGLGDHRSQYINNQSYVDEYLGNKLKRLTIEFIEPSQFGFDDLAQRKATAICSYTHDRVLHSKGGHACHLVLPSHQGCEMRSGFWLGRIEHHFKPLHVTMKRLYNSKLFRSKIISDQMALSLLTHCAEEMNHLAKILPGLYREAAL